MKKLRVTEDLFYGTVSLEHVADGIKPWRIPYPDYDLFPPNGIEGKGAICAGVRLRMRTNSTHFVLTFAELDDDARMDCMLDGRLHATVQLRKGDTAASFHLQENPASGATLFLQGTNVHLEIYLPQNIGMTITGMYADETAEISAWPDQRPRWVTYGSSITQCVAASSPSRTWPSIAAARLGLNLTNLGYSGNCHMEPMVARMIRDLPADYISLCLGINVYGAATLSPRTFRSAVIGMLELIREKHAATPLLVISPIFAPDRETNENKLGLTLTGMREDIRDIVACMQRRGDRHIDYLDGLALFSSADAGHLPDGLHPDAHGYELIGNRFAEKLRGWSQINQG